MPVTFVRLVVWFWKEWTIYACDFCETSSVISQSDFEEWIIYACDFYETGGVISQGDFEKSENLCVRLLWD